MGDNVDDESKENSLTITTEAYTQTHKGTEPFLRMPFISDNKGDSLRELTLICGGQA